MKDLELLHKIEEFLNRVPNKQYGNNYKLVVDLERFIKKYKYMTNVLQILKNDAHMALDRNWDKSDEGFKTQIDMINTLLNSKLRDYGNNG